MVAVTNCVAAAHQIAKGSEPRQRNEPRRNVLVAAHRGGYANDKADDAPENSLANLELAIRRGFDVYETDIQRTSDGIFVIMHDETIDRETNGTGRISEMTYAEVRQLKKRFRDGSLSNHPVATLEQLLTAGRGRILFKPDLKKGVISHFVDLTKLIHRCEMQDQVFLRMGLGDRKKIAKYFGEGCPKIEVMFKVGTSKQAKSVIAQFQPATLQVNLEKGEVVSEDKAAAINYAASRGVLVETHVYSDVKQWDQLAALGVRMFHTAAPDRVLAHLQEKGFHATASRQAGAVPEFWLIGSYPSGWGSKIPRPNEIDFTLFTHIMHFGIYPTRRGEITDELGDDKADVIKRAHAAGTKVVAVIGSEGYGKQFVGATSDKFRKRFVRNIIDFMKKHKYDGISIDWEEDVPGHEEQLSQLMVELHAELKDLEPRPLLMIDVISGLIPPSLSKKVEPLVDSINLMTYFEKGDMEEEYNAHIKAGISAQKLVMGAGIDDDYYDNHKHPERLRRKMRFSKDKGLRGVEFWSFQATPIRKKQWESEFLRIIRQYRD
jgi:hypothetical protein